MEPTLVSEHFQRKSPHPSKALFSLVRIGSVEVCERELELHGARFLNLNLQRVKTFVRRNPLGFPNCILADEERYCKPLVFN